MLSIAIIDIIGLPYDGSTLTKTGLGGSESAIILMGRELVKQGFSVTVFCHCNIDNAQEGIYDGVEYLGLDKIKDHPSNFDIVISSRTVVPFIRADQYSQFTNLHYNFEKLKKNAKHRVVWLHDTFCVGDNLLESLVVDGDIHEIFTLSDFHTNYVSTCNHGEQRRMYETLKQHTWQTRNGINRWIDEVDLSAKDPDLFIYNSSVTKGMLPLVKLVWPLVKARIPQAKLKIIGGYYRFRKDVPPDEQEKTWHDLVKQYDKQLGIEFTGIISQQEIARICANASFMLYPTAFPETYGISALESLNYNTPLITCRFGAIEEVATELSSYLINYPIEPNVLYPKINTNEQVQKFVELTIRAHADRYLLQQKQNYCDIFRDISGWDSVSLQWKQHFYHKFNLNLDVEDYRKVTKINTDVHRIFQRRNMNPEEFQHPASESEMPIAIITPFYNAESYIVDCMKSVMSQSYENYRLYLVDDASTDSSIEKIDEYLKSISYDLNEKVTVIRNKTNVGAVRNIVDTIHSLGNDDWMIMLLDGDDKLAPRNDIFKYYNELYKDGVEFTYGSCWSMVDNIPLIAQTYPKAVRTNKTYRKHKFNWGMPYTHLRTFRKYLMNDIPDSKFKDENGEWYRAGGDNAVFYNILEKADPNNVVAVKEIHYHYNDKNPLNDYKVNATEQTNAASQITSQPTPNMQMKLVTNTKKKILIAIPTAKNIEVETFKSIFDLDVPDGYELDFQYFYGYRIDQIRNLIADFTQRNNFDYLFSVDSDIILPKDTLTKMLASGKQFISGVYLQRKDHAKIPELYRHHTNGGQINMHISEVQGDKLIEIAGCGFGCVLVATEILRNVGYPQFVYHNTLDFKYTISEDVDFCRKATEKGYKIYVDTSIKCTHLGTKRYEV